MEAGASQQAMKLAESLASSSPQANAALGAFLGAAAADAAGAVLEFLGRAPDPADVDRAVAQPGGGTWKLAPGQITDDTELAIALADGLIAGNAGSAPAVNLDGVAVAYGKWSRSRPFDIGSTTSKALSAAPLSQTPGCAAALAMHTAQFNMSSQANGSLMRATPLGIFAHRLPATDAGRAGARDSALTHPNPAVCGAEAAYVAAVAHLVRCPGDSAGALAAAKSALAAGAAEWIETIAWLDIAEKDALRVPYYPQAGYAKIAFTHAFRHLAARTPYEDALKETLLGGGDTDTNAAIVCGLVGALHGFEAIPERLWRPVLECDTGKGRERPEWLSGARIPGLVKCLLELAPGR
ncbi:ADP-ribosylation/Crystallin J1 [Hyaloraphidium curvatum]|nr:ADP-ribosylation/Crystallin J1 [Hyaloraphidium curvatum]